MRHNSELEKMSDTKVQIKNRNAVPSEQLVCHWKQLGEDISPTKLVSVQGVVDACRPILLESALMQPGLSRFSYVECVQKDKNITVKYDAEKKVITQKFADDIQEINQSIFDYLETHFVSIQTSPKLCPFPFTGGFIGWFGYELKCELLNLPKITSDLPDALFKKITQFFVIDHKTGKTYGAVVMPETAKNQDIQRELDAMQALVDRTKTCNDDTDNLRTPSAASSEKAIEKVVFTARINKSDYIDRIEDCRELLRQGESYELCLTNTFEAKLEIDAWECYQLLSSRNAATYAAFVQIDGIDLICASPECFVKVDADRIIESKPIKGTIKRGLTPKEDKQNAQALLTSEKDVSENMMIADLLRHDIWAVSIPKTVNVPVLAGLETFPHVHHLVSTIRGTLKPELTAMDAFKSCFPGGSMTGAPKLRSVQLLEGLETGPRGVYSGSVAWVGFNGQMNSNIIIRSIVQNNGTVSIGSGGAITYLSSAAVEFNETLLKSEIILRSVAELTTGNPENYLLCGTNGMEMDAIPIEDEDVS